MGTEAVTSDLTRWQDLPGAVLSHLLELAPYKRADVKLVCQSWRCAINAAIKTVSLPADDLNLLHQLTAVHNLTAAAPRAGVRIGAEPHSAAATSSSHKPPAAHSPAATSSTAANPWCSAHPSTMQRLQVLQLQGCPSAWHQLSEWQIEQLHASSSSVSRGTSSRPGLDSLAALQLAHLGDVSGGLPEVLTGQGAQHGHVHLDSATSSRAAMQPWPLQHLSQLQISHCRLGTHSSGGLLKLSALQQLPGLQSLELSHCQLEEVPAAVYACTALTQLSLAHNDIVYLNPQLASLQRLQVLDLCSNTSLCSLRGAVGHLTSLTELDLSGPNMLSCEVPDEPGANCSSGSYAVPLQAIGDSSPPVVVNTRDGAGLQPLSHQQQLQALPDLAQLTNLRKLSLAHNRDMSVLPGSLSVLTQLEVLDARSCSLRFPPDELWACVGLRELLLGDNVLAGLPDDISKLQKLEVLDIGRCMTLWQLPSALLSLSQLRRLVLATKAVGQYIVERLELRSVNPVDVEFDPGQEEDPHLEHSNTDDWDGPPSLADDDELSELLEVVDLGVGVR